ncbi:hypothetical protein B0H12DRAFT_1156544 [Mycena haematopus]|nr:hypothetical protein B0H12DRAFT_1156544 [Mycena haematopus]
MREARDNTRTTVRGETRRVERAREGSRGRTNAGEETWTTREPGTGRICKQRQLRRILFGIPVASSARNSFSFVSLQIVYLNWTWLERAVADARRERVLYVSSRV